MKQAKKKALEKAGWKVGDTWEFLGMRAEYYVIQGKKIARRALRSPAREHWIEVHGGRMDTWNRRGNKRALWHRIGVYHKQAIFEMNLRHIERGEGTPNRNPYARRDPPPKPWHGMPVCGDCGHPEINCVC